MKDPLQADSDDQKGQLSTAPWSLFMKCVYRTSTSLHYSLPTKQLMSISRVVSMLPENSITFY